MRYVFLAYGDEKQLDTLSAAERDALGNERLANQEVLRKSGHLLAAQDLRGGGAVTTVRVHNGKVSIADGPFAEANERLIGIFTIDARDLNEAIRVASKMPEARGGPIEVRPLLDFDQH
jgi:hypothetical protein